MVIGYKRFYFDWAAPSWDRKQCTCPGTLEEDVDFSDPSAGILFSKDVLTCVESPYFDITDHIAEVIAYGEVYERGNVYVTDKLEIVREIPWGELMTIANAGKECTGLKNTGNRDSGNWNSGNWNTGDWNKASYSNGCFNTVEPKIYLFNKPSDWTYKDWACSEANALLRQIPWKELEFVPLSKMSDDEIKKHPEAGTTGGYLRKSDDSNSAVEWWRNLSEKDKKVIVAIPNFDKQIFEEITGIDIDAE